MPVVLILSQCNTRLRLLYLLIKYIYYMASSVSCDWLPERARWSYLARSGLPALFRKKNFPESHVINPLLTKLVRSRWLDIGVVLFLRVYRPRSITTQKKELGQYPVILTSPLVNNPYIRIPLYQKYSRSEGIKYNQTRD